MNPKIMAKARIKVLIEVSLTDIWGGDCPLSQVYKQAKDSAMNIVSQKIAGSMKDIRIIGEPQVVAIIADEGR